MADTIYLNQKLTLTLTAKTAAGSVISLSSLTVHFLSLSPLTATTTTDESPTISTPGNGQVEHVYDATDLDEVGDWKAKLLIDTVEVPSTSYIFHVANRWDT